uniref:BED-type domain-containing protein n=1 Tax=Anopheles atroparvus TaxID=41427 RepID=A0AAG5DRX0_ANOAO
MSQTTSDIWQHFTKSEGGAKSRYCSQMLSHNRGSTSNTKRHLERKHPTVPLYRNMPSTSGTQPDPDTPIVADSDKADNSQGKIACYFSSNKPLSSEAKKLTDSLLLLMICKEYRPFSIVEDEYFARFVKSLNPKYVLPTRKTLSNASLPALYNDTFELVKSNLKNSSTVSLTADCWTNINQLSFCAVTAHFMNYNNELCSHLLECSEFSVRH